MSNQITLDAIHDRWLEPPEQRTVFYCECCGEDVCIGDEFIEFGNGERWIKEHADELGEQHFEKYDDYCVKIAGQTD